MSYLLFLDDTRDANKFLKDNRTWITVRNYTDFVKIIKKQGLPDLISFDFDIPYKQPDEDYYTEKTGLDCAKWLILYCNENRFDLPKYQVHSMNPEGAKNIKSLLESYRKIQNKENTNE